MEFFAPKGEGFFGFLHKVQLNRCTFRIRSLVRTKSHVIVLALKRINDGAKSHLNNLNLKKQSIKKNRYT